MRKTNHSRPAGKRRVYNQPIYPNAADDLYFSQVARNLLNIILLCSGFGSMLLFLSAVV